MGRNFVERFFRQNIMKWLASTKSNGLNFRKQNLFKKMTPQIFKNSTVSAQLKIIHILGRSWQTGGDDNFIGQPTGKCLLAYKLKFVPWEYRVQCF